MNHSWSGFETRRPSIRLGWFALLFLLSGGMVIAVGGRPAQARSISATGTLKPIETVTLGTMISGTVQEVSCAVNMIVRKGQICAQIDPRPYQRAIEVSRAELATASALLEQHMASFNLAKATYQRNVTLLDRGVVTRAVYESAESVYKQAEAQIEFDKAVIEQRKAQLATAELNLSYTKIASPIDGIVLDRRVSVGETLSSSLQSPSLFVVASDLTKMHAVVRINEVDIGAFRATDNAKINVKAFPNQSFRGKVNQIRYQPQAAGSVVSYEVLIDVDNIELYLRPGMSVAVEVEVTG